MKKKPNKNKNKKQEKARFLVKETRFFLKQGSVLTGVRHVKHAGIATLMSDFTRLPYLPAHRHPNLQALHRGLPALLL